MYLNYILFSIPLGIIAGFIGTLLGIGGGSIITPLLILYGIEPRLAISSSLIAILGTSTGGIHKLIRRGLVKIRTALFLESASISGAVLGALTAISLPSRIAILVVGIALAISATLFATQRVEETRKPFMGYRTSKGISWFLSFLAGILSATGGVGGGVIKTPILVLVLGLDVKSAIATSKLMVGITACSGAIVYGYTGFVDLAIAIPLTIATYIGASIGAKVLTKLRPRKTKLIATIAYSIFSVSMIMKFFGLI